MSTLRWSWTDYLLIDEIIDVRYAATKPNVFIIHYAHIYSQQTVRRAHHHHHRMMAARTPTRAHHPLSPQPITPSRPEIEFESLAGLMRGEERPSRAFARASNRVHLAAPRSTSQLHLVRV